MPEDQVVIVFFFLLDGDGDGDVSLRGTVHQSFPDFTFLTGNWIGKLMKLKGEIDPEIAIDLSNKATLAFLQRHLGKTEDKVIMFADYF